MISSREESSETPSSGTRSPALAANPDRASASYITNMWTGLIRRFSSEDSRFPSQADTAYDHDGTNKDGIKDVFNPGRRRTISPFRPPPLDPLIMHGFSASTPTSARLLTGAVAEEIRTMIPERLRIVDDWHLIYSLDQDGASLTTLYQRCLLYKGKRAGFVLVVKDQEGGVRTGNFYT